ncbi:Tyrosine-protein kinase [Trichostrongylus colubriformis]|uniref:Tyrosine-protein kinase n=1 Tax=Trichostrongylus colubriformis TaxID=6319 RepID=A0AAN8ICY1_TRICO
MGENRLFTLDGNFRNPDIAELIKFHKESGTPIGQGVKLKTPIPKQKWELTRDKITMGEKIGEGNFCEVFAGKLKEGSTAPVIDVAIKKTKVTAENRQKINEMYKEARIMRQYKHRNIVAFYGIVDDGSVDVMIVMELVHGGGLDVHIRKNPDEHYSPMLVMSHMPYSTYI